MSKTVHGLHQTWSKCDVHCREWRNHSRGFLATCITYSCKQIPWAYIWWEQMLVPSGKLTVCYWKWPFSSLIYPLKFVSFHVFCMFTRGYVLKPLISDPRWSNHIHLMSLDWESMGKLRAVPRKFTFPKSFHPNLMATLRVGQPILQNMLTENEVYIISYSS